MTIRIVSYNVGGVLDVGAVATVLAALQPDVVCLQEASRRLTVRRLARRAGLDVVVRAGRPGTATAILTSGRARVLSQHSRELTTAPEVPRRSLAHAIIGVGSLRLSVIACQLGLRPEQRAVNADELLAFVDSVGAPTVVGCDLNESPKGAVATRLTSHLQDAFAVAGEGPGETYPTPDPSSRQDFVLVDRQLAVARCSVPTAAPVDIASHHRPVLAEVALAAIEPDARAERRAEESAA